MQLKTIEAHYATANKWNTLCTREQMKNTCNCKEMKHTTQMQRNEANFGTANK